MAGASIDLEKTSQDYQDTDTGYFWSHFSLWNYARPPSVILEVSLGPGFQQQGRSRAPGKSPAAPSERDLGQAEGQASGGGGECVEETRPLKTRGLGLLVRL